MNNKFLKLAIEESIKINSGNLKEYFQYGEEVYLVTIEKINKDLIYESVSNESIHFISASGSGNVCKKCNGSGME